MSRHRIYSLLALLVLSYTMSCIDPVEIIKDVERGDLVVDGLITNESGPHFVTLTQSRSIKSDLDNQVFVTGAFVLVEDDLGNLDTLAERSPGVYQTSPEIIRGEVGRQYRLQIKTKAGDVYKTDFQELLPVGEIDSAYAKLTQKYFINNLGYEQLKYDFDLFANGTMPQTNSFAQWKWKATYEVLTYPKYRTRESRNDPDFGNSTVTLPDPPRCSGYIFIKELYLQSGLAYYSLGEDCVCCQCWVTEFSGQPVVTSNQFNQNRFYDVALGSIPTENIEPFRYRYKVAVEMLSVNEEIYRYYETVATQGSNNLFIPPIGKLNSNIQPVDGAPEAFGNFRVSAVSRKSFYINSTDLPFGLNEPADSLLNDCRLLKNATNQRPPDWN